MSGLPATSFSASPGTDRSPIRVSMGKLEAGGGGESTTSWRMILEIGVPPSLPSAPAG